MADPCTHYEERAAILEYVAGYPRHVAEVKAREQLAARERVQFEMFDTGLSTAPQRLAATTLAPRSFPGLGDPATPRQSGSHGASL